MPFCFLVFAVYRGGGRGKKCLRFSWLFWVGLRRLYMPCEISRSAPQTTADCVEKPYREHIEPQPLCTGSSPVIPDMHFNANVDFFFVCFVLFYSLIKLSVLHFICWNIYFVTNNHLVECKLRSCANPSDMYNVIKFTLTIVSFKFFNSEGRKPTILNILVQNDNPWQDACLIPFFQSNAKPGQTAVMIKTLNCFFFFFFNRDNFHATKQIC